MAETEFNKKAECMEYCKTNNLQFYQRDLNSNSTKIFIADTHENIFNKIKNGQNIYYESWKRNQSMKLYIDYDRKIETTDPTDLKERLRKPEINHKSEILNIINIIRQLLPNITAVNILKSIPSIEKKSYHIIFEGLHFPSYSNIKEFMEELIKPKLKELFDKKVIDMSVYEPKCFRSLLCTKMGQNRPLYLLETEPFLTELQEIPITKEATTLNLFLKTCITHIENDSVLYTHKSDKKKESSKKIHLMSGEDIYSDKEIVKKYIDILDPDRYTDRNKWLNIGFILYSINNTYRDLWHYFSAKWDQYDEQSSDITWYSFVNSEYIYTINNLIYLARIDNPDESNSLSKEIPNHDIKYLRPFDNVLSKLIYRIYGENFICSNPQKDEWYYFNGIRWKKENRQYNLRYNTINEVFTRVENYRRQLIKEGASEEIIKNYYTILTKLGSGNKFNCLEIEFYNENFYKIIDQDKDLLGFENGIYDLKTMEFRRGTCSDYISMSTGYDYIDHSENDIVYKELMTLLTQILPDPQIRHFTLKSIASCLDGHNRDENFYVWTGKHASAGNGKSTLTELSAKTLGEYAVDSPVSLITGKRESSNSANSALTQIIKKRMVIMQEPGSNDQLQADVLKSLTGGDRISTRELFGTQMEFKPMAKFFLPCNKIPGMSDIDDGVSRRLKIIEFSSCFVDNPRDTFENGTYEFKKDKNLKSKLESYKSVFMSILINYYKIYKEEGLAPPEQVMKITKKYENNNNNMKMFIEENIIKGKKTDWINLDDIRNLYKGDYTLRSNFNKQSNFISQLENSLYSEFRYDNKLKIKKLEGYYIKGPDIDDTDDE